MLTISTVPKHDSSEASTIQCFTYTPQHKIIIEIPWHIVEKYNKRKEWRRKIYKNYINESISVLDIRHLSGK